MENPSITTIILTYRRPQLLKRAIASVLNQTYPHLQVRVYDNASGDETQDVVREFIKKDARVKYYCHAQNIGMIGNYHYSLSEVNTTYFSFLSDDDLIFPWFYEEALRGLRQFPECAFFAGSALIMSEEGEVIRVPLDLWKKQGYFAPSEALLEMISKYPVPTCALFHRKVIDAVPIDQQNALTWDCDFFIQIAARYPVFISKRPCGIFLHHTGSYSHSQELTNWTWAQNKMIERLNHTDCLDPDVKEAAISLIHLDIGMTNRAFIFRALLSKKWALACEYERLFRKKDGLNFKTLLFFVLTRSCLWFPFAIQALLLLRRLKRWSNRKAQNPYEHYAKWLKGENENCCD